MLNFAYVVAFDVEATQEDAKLAILEQLECQFLFVPTASPAMVGADQEVSPRNILLYLAIKPKYHLWIMNAMIIQFLKINSEY